MGREIPLWQVLLVGVALISSLILEIVWIGTGEAHFALLFTAVFAAIISMANGWKWETLEKGISRSVSKALQAIIILMLVAIMRSVWIAGGVIPTLVYYGIDYIYPQAFLCMTFALCSFLSFFTGYSWALAGSAGVVLVDIGSAAGIPAGMIAGAVVSGVYFGEKLSPVSDSVNMQAIAADVELYQHVKYAFRTGIPTFFISLLVYYLLGRANSCGATMSAAAEQIRQAVTTEFVINPALIFVPVIVMFTAMHFKNVIPAFAVGIGLGIICMFAQGEAVGKLMETLMYGTDYGDPFLTIIGEETPLQTNMFKSFGLYEMVWNLWLVICAMALCGIMTTSGMLRSVADSILTLANTEKKLVTSTILTSIATNFIVADQYQSILVPGIMYRDAYDESGVDRRKLSRCLGDAATVTSNLVPWNSCGIVMAATLGVSVWGADGYAIYAFFCWLCPLVNIIYTKLDLDRIFSD